LGIRILAHKDEEDPRTPGIDEHLPLGWGMPMMVIEDESDIIEWQD